jgi:hypothetical protein
LLRSGPAKLDPLVGAVTATGQQKAARFAPGGFLLEKAAELLQLHFLVFDVLACFGIKFHDQHFLGHRLLVLGRGVEVAGTRSGFQLDLVASAFACHGVSP